MNAIVTNPKTHAHRILDCNEARAFIMAGDATFTVVSKRTGDRMTLRFKRAKAKGDGSVSPYFVSKLNRPDNSDDNSYDYVGWLRKGYRDGLWDVDTTRKSVYGKSHKVYRTVEWLWNKVKDGNGSLPDSVEFWTEGRCCMCGRKLTVPSSISRYLGPVCANKPGAAALAQFSVGAVVADDGDDDLSFL